VQYNQGLTNAPLMPKTVEKNAFATFKLNSVSSLSDCCRNGSDTVNLHPVYGTSIGFCRTGVGLLSIWGHMAVINEVGWCGTMQLWWRTSCDLVARFQGFSVLFVTCPKTSVSLKISALILYRIDFMSFALFYVLVCHISALHTL